MNQEPQVPSHSLDFSSNDLAAKFSSVSRRDFLQKVSDGCGLLAVGALAGSATAAAQAPALAAPEATVTPLVPALPGPGFRPNDESLFRFQKGVKSAWINVRTGSVPLNKMVEMLQPGQRRTIAALDGPGVIDRLWITFDWPGKTGRYPNSMLRKRGVIVECFWDGAEKPAVSAPIGDFFGHHLGYSVPFESALFSDPSGRSFDAAIPMPFRKQARIEVINDFDKPIAIYPIIKYRTGVTLNEEDGYFHAHWARSVGIDPENGHPVLPEVTGRGRYLGTQMGIISTPAMKNAAWHDGNLVWFLDDDTAQPTLTSTTLDDYANSSWDYDMLYTHRECGLMFTKYFEDGGGHHGLYRHHLRDLIQFERRCRVAQIQRPPGDDISTTALFYLDRPEGIADSCLANKDRVTPAHHWPLADGTV